MRNVLNIEASKIFVPEGHMRPIRDAQVEGLRDSIGKGRLLQPLVVGVPNADKPWPLVDGAHRLAALKKLNGALFFDKGHQGRAPTLRDRGKSCEVSPDCGGDLRTLGRAEAFEGGSVS